MQSIVMSFDIIPRIVSAQDALPLDSSRKNIFKIVDSSRISTSMLDEARDLGEKLRVEGNCKE